ncbi:MAG: galactokinase [Gemmatimonadaceae bacterium]
MTAGRAASLFHTTFARWPRVVASAPGRVNLIGEHTDYNGGEVLPIAIAQRTWVAMGPVAGSESRAVSATQSLAGRFSVASGSPAGQWWDYVHGTLRELDTLGVHTGEVNVAIASDVPSGAGLSSSAALEVATALAGVVSAKTSMVTAWDAVAAVAHRAETQFVGVSCGMMDQAACTYATEGHALRIWCESGRLDQVPFSQSVLVIDTAVPRDLRSSSAFHARQRSCGRALRALQQTDPELTALAGAEPESLDAVPMDDADRRRARHVIAETRRVGRFVDALRSGAPLGELLYASHTSLRTDYDCSSPELDWVVEFASRANGIDGARMTGAGWGGCAIAVGTEDGLQALGTTIAPAYAQRWGHPPRVWLTRAEEGGDIDETELFTPGAE